MNKYQEAINHIRLVCLANSDDDEVITSNDMRTIEHLNTLQELVDRATPKKPIIIPNDSNILRIECPYCHKVTITNFPRNFCGECGQALGWEQLAE